MTCKYCGFHPCKCYLTVTQLNKARKPKVDRAWTDNDIATLKLLWLEGETAGKISKTFHRSRNSILGKLHRLGIKRSGKELSGK